MKNINTINIYDDATDTLKPTHLHCLLLEDSWYIEMRRDTAVLKMYGGNQEPPPIFKTKPNNRKIFVYKSRQKNRHNDEMIAHKYLNCILFFSAS